MFSSVAFLYTVTAAVSIILALFLYKLARMSSQAASAREDRTRGAGGYGRLESSSMNLSLDHVIREEVGKVADLRRSQEIVTRISSVVSEELKKKVEQSTQEVSRRRAAVS